MDQSTDAAPAQPVTEDRNTFDENTPATITTTATTTTTTTTTTPTPTVATATIPAPAPTTTATNTFTSASTSFEEIQKQLKATLDHVEQRNMVSGFQTLGKATSAVVDHCEQLGTKMILPRSNFCHSFDLISSPT